MLMQEIPVKLKGSYTHNDTKIGKRRGLLERKSIEMKEGNGIENEEKELYKCIKMLKNK